MQHLHVPPQKKASGIKTPAANTDEVNIIQPRDQALCPATIPIPRDLPCALLYGQTAGSSVLEMLAMENSPAAPPLPVQPGRENQKSFSPRKFICMKRQLFAETGKPLTFPLLFNLKLKFAAISQCSLC